MEELINRLENWKFSQAYVIAKSKSLTSIEHQTISTLATLFQDCGWMDGEFAELLRCIVELLCQSIRRRNDR